MAGIVVPGYSTSDRLPRFAFALLLGQGNRTPAQSPLEVFLVGPRAYNAAGDTVLGTATDAVPVQLYSADDAEDLWGAGSPMHRMASRLLSSYRGATMWGVSAAKGVAAVRATYTISITGAATASGVLRYAICDKVVEAPVASGALNDAVGAALALAINTDTSLPVYASYADVGDLLTLTVKWFGPTGGTAAAYKLDLDAISVPAGLIVGAAAVGAAGAVDCVWADAYDAAFNTGVQFDYILPATHDVTLLTSGSTSLKAKIAARLAPEIGHLVTALLARVDDAPGDADALTDALDGGTTDWNETGYWSQVFWSANSRAEPWCVAAAWGGLRIQAEESSPQANWITASIGGPSAPSMIPPLLTNGNGTYDPSLGPAAGEPNTAIGYGLSPVRYDFAAGSCHLDMSITAKHELGSNDALTMIENTNVPAVCRAVSYGIAQSLALAYAGFSVVADVDGEEPEDLPSRTTSPYLIKSFLIATMKKDYEKRGWVQRVEAHRADTAVEQDASYASRILYELPMDVPRWTLQFVGVHREVGGTV